MCSVAMMDKRLQSAACNHILSAKEEQELGPMIVLGRELNAATEALEAELKRKPSLEELSLRTGIPPHQLHYSQQMAVQVTQRSIHEHTLHLLWPIPRIGNRRKFCAHVCALDSHSLRLTWWVKHQSRLPSQ